MIRAIQISILLFFTSSINIHAQSTGTFTDYRDSLTYKTIQIGDHIWLAENLKFWVSEDSPHYVGESSVYEWKEANLIKYGRLYQWETACNVCPEGWHLPSMQEWYTLLNYNGEIFPIGYTPLTIKEMRKIPKEERKARKELIKDTFQKFQFGDESGFDVLYGGYLDQGGPGPFTGIGTVARFWSSNGSVTYGPFKKSKAEAIRFLLWGKVIEPWGVGRTVYCSVRCVKD